MPDYRVTVYYTGSNYYDVTADDETQALALGRELDDKSEKPACEADDIWVEEV